ncbi:stage II sporulation protein D [Caminicella sporogenes DSM 14501]|uniref:Stage II sporulation protein D n=1 Tax=Caminicella sporogenes DSM 14501 TaxID=1121266 RepID=A0A1M6M1S0_9FIRM|nr:SpoIID/LytB domain-containing protein [Caminicella sporogenes]RKD28032.1 hypothetical protein BET04_02950 [Caminicella sporogenes]SHJ77419.1 stage II sporulation protein D [Caminicella sporogenes DSM 14501]
MRKKIFIAHIVLFFFLMSCVSVWGFSKQDIPYAIKVGLRYGENAASVVNLHSNTGFEFGFYDNNYFNTLLNLADKENIVVRKDSYYVDYNGAYMEVNDISSISFSKLYGPFHVEIDEYFSSREEMEEFLVALKDYDIEFYPVYENGWRIWGGLFTSKYEAEDFINSYGQVNNKNLKVVNPNNKRIQVLDKRGNVLLIYNSLERDFYFTPIVEKDSDQIINIDGKNYRGDVIFKRYLNSDITVINYLTLQEYLYGVVPKEMSGDWPLEALKAQAVAARNYAVANMGKHSNYGFDLCSGIDCQVYGGYDAEKPRSNMAVDETDGKVLTYDGKVINAFFHSNSGGHTEDSENVWSLYIPYIRGVEDEFSLDAPNSKWIQVYSPDEISDVLNSKGFNIGQVCSIYPEEYSKNGRVLSLKIKGSLSDLTLKKEETRKIFGYSKIKSMNFTVETDASFYIKSSIEKEAVRKSLNNVHILGKENFVKIVDGGNYFVSNGEKNVKINGKPSKYIFKGKGWGHGLGMSQWGAKKMAELGYTYEEILKHYYTGTKLE